jgi:hypothetical protein
MKLTNVQMTVLILAVVVILAISGGVYYKSGYEAGFKKGSDAAYASGYQQGKATGTSEGYQAGYTSGKTDGYNAGVAAGHDQGYSEGVASGYSNGYDEGYNKGNSNYIYNNQFSNYDNGCCGGGGIPGNQMGADPNYWYMQGQTNK